MTIALLMDQHVPRAITIGLRRRGVDVLTAYEDGSHELSDPNLLDRAGQLNRVLFTRDSDFLIEVARRQQEGISLLVLFMPINYRSLLVNAWKIWKSLPKQVSLKI